MRKIARFLLIGGIIFSSLSFSAQAYDGRYVHRYVKHRTRHVRTISKSLSPRIYVVVWYGKTHFVPHIEKFYHETPAMVLQEELKSRGYRGVYVVNMTQEEYSRLIKKIKWSYVDSCLLNVQYLDLSKYPMFNVSLFKQNVQQLLAEHSDKNISSDNLCRVSSLSDFLYKVSLVRLHDKGLEDLAYGVYLYLQELKEPRSRNQHNSNERNR